MGRFRVFVVTPWARGDYTHEYSIGTQLGSLMHHWTPWSSYEDPTGSYWIPMGGETL